MKSYKGTLRAEVSKIIPLSQKKAVSIYRDYNNWNKLFPLTIRGAKLIGETGNQQTIEVDHKQAGKVINILTPVSNEEIRLEEFKRLYNATFINRFEQVRGITRYVLTGYISFKGFVKILQPFLKAVVKNRMNKFVLEPFKRYAYAEKAEKKQDV